MQSTRLSFLQILKELIVEIKIRLATPDDAVFIVDFQIIMAQETENIILDKEIVNQGVRAVFNDRSKGEYWVAENDSTIIASMLMTPEWSDWRNATILWFQSVYVIPEYRSKGVFRNMYKALKQKVKSTENLGGLRLYVDKTNHIAQNAYRNLGMNGDHYNFYEWMKDF